MTIQPPDRIESFQGPYSFLSNFHPAGIKYGPEGWTWPTVEHAYQAAKTDMPAERAEILEARTPGKAKRLGQDVTLRPGWNGGRRMVMLALLRLKFQIPHLREWLLATGEVILIEGNNWGDTYWGVCNGHGDNHLGLLLMVVRGEIRGDF